MSVPHTAPPTTTSRTRIVVLVAVLIGLFVVGKVTGWTDSFDVGRIRALVGRAGPFGYLFFFVIFAAGELIHVPGGLFVVAAVLAFGRTAGFVAGLVGGMVSVSTTFFVIRWVGGRALGSVRHPLMRRLLSHLDERPIVTIFLLRVVFWLAPPLNYALALSNVRFREYFVGSLLGLVVPIALIAVFVERFLQWFG